ncbi:TrbI/VirB10 family protein [Erythrobacter sp. F6033]|uniref:TrbI/VirB10 family protein n=1 Tax=Erythrobacter sp. F6033 TaxID=2926401 RepID=UPI001FF4CE95|nr:TrbI/VirB10 family protein [Erythrobacter sp. F6033]MCK0127706.1 type VI secretion protein [Erythrobacter sp. F6033]
MRLAMRLPGKKGEGDTPAEGDPRDSESAEIIDLASRNGFPAVIDRKAKSEGLGLAAGVAIVGLLGAVTFWAMNAAQQTGDQQAVGNPNVAAPAQVAAAPVAPAPVNAPQEVQPAAAPTPTPILSNNPNASRVPVTNPYASPTMVFDASTGTQGNRLVEAPATPVASATSTGDTGALGSAAAFASRVGGVGGGPAQARPMTNPSTTVTEGTLIPAILETAINTDVPGYVRAVVSQDVLSFDGRNVLVPRSSRLIGQYQSGVQQGQKRAYVIWTRLIRPDGVSVNIASPAVGFDGTTGLAGDVDSKFFQRFGSALLLSLVDGLGAIASGGTSVILGGGQSAASTALQQDGQIGPTIRVSPGEPIRVFAARDLDFSTVQ